MWLFIIGGIFYYSIPVLSYFSSQVPKLSSDTLNKVKEINNFSSKATKNAKNTITETTEKPENTINNFSEGSGLVSVTEENLIPLKKDGESSSETMSRDEYLRQLSYIQNQKQEH